MAATRIKNNQITDSTIIGSAKIVPGTLVSSLFASNLTLQSNITVTGNFTVQGNTTTVSSINTLVNDPLVVFNNGYVGTPTYDIGILASRNAPSNYNAAWIWREANVGFAGMLTTTTEGTGSAVTTVVNSGYANLIIGNTTIDSSFATDSYNTSSGALVVKGGAGIASNLNVGGTYTVFGTTSGPTAISSNSAIVQVTQGSGTRPGLMITDTNNNGALTLRTGAFGGQLSTYGGTSQEIYIQPNNQASLHLAAANGAVIAESGLNSSNANVGAIVVTGSGGIGIGGNLNVGTSASFEGGAIFVQSSKQQDVAVGQGILKSGLGANTTVIGSGLATTSVGSNTTLVGYGSGPAAAPANSTYVGALAGNLATGSSNQFFGFNSGHLVTTGQNNAIFGGYDGNTIATLSNYTIISDGAGNPRVQIDNTGNVWVISSVDSSSTTTGALTTKGGVGIGKSLNVGLTANIGTTQTPGTVSLNVSGDTYMAGNLTVASNLFVLGSTTNINSNTVTIEDSILNLHFFGNLLPLNFNDSRDIGVLTNYYKGAAQKSYFGWQNSTSNFVYIDNASESSGNVISGTYGNVQFGSLWLSNTTASSGDTTGALVVKGGIGVGANSYINSLTIDSQLNTPKIIVAGSGGLYLSQFSANSVLFVNPTDQSISQSNNQFNFQSTTANTFSGVSLSVGTNADMTGTDTINGYYQHDQYLPNSLISANTVGQAPGFTVSTARGTGTAPAISQDGDFIGLFGAYNYSGSTAAYQEAAAWRYVTQGTTGAASGIGGQAQLWTKQDNGASTLAIRVDANQTATFTGQVVVSNTAATTNSTTGALYIAGGQAVGGNLVVAQSARFNDTQNANRDFYVRGGNDATLIWANTLASYNSVIIGNSAVAGNLVTGAKLVVNATDSFLPPVGNPGQRPVTPVAGMMRFNSTLADMEYYTGTQWFNPQSIGGVSTVYDAQINGDGSTTQWNVALYGGTISSTNGVFVSINGVVQLPGSAYTAFSGNSFVIFSEAPAVGDVIDIRTFTTASTVTSLSSPNGYVTAYTTNDGLFVTSGTTNANISVKFAANVTGGVNYYAGNIAVGTSAVVIDSWNMSYVRNAKYTITVFNPTLPSANSYETSEVSVLSDSTNAYRTQYNRTYNNAALGSVTVNTSGGFVQVLYTGNNAGNRVYVYPTYFS
jgi:hypothetical protein